MFRSRLVLFLFLSLLAVSAVQAQTSRSSTRKNRTASDRTDTKKKADSWKEHRYGKIKIRIRQVRSGNYDVRGALPPETTVRELAEMFFSALDILPPSFLEKSRIRHVTFLDDLTLKKVPAGGVASGDAIYLNTKSSSRTVYHELFHAFDPSTQINQNRKWMGFNNKNFVYTGSGFDNMKVTKFRRKRRQDNLATGRFNDDFVSRYAITRRMRMKEIRQLKIPAALEQYRVLPPGSGLLVQPEKSRAPAGFHSMAAGRTGQTPSRRDPGIDRRPFLVVAPVQRFLRSGRKIMTGNMSFRGERYS